MHQPRLCLQTQTPLIRPLRPIPPASRLHDLVEGEDYLLSPGGVTRMLRGLASRLEEKGWTDAVTWISLARDEATLLKGRARLELVALPHEEIDAYAKAKSALWDEIHGLRGELARVEDMQGGLRALARRLGARARDLHAEDPFDIFYTHDFQLLEAARELPPDVPRVFRWHVPVRPLRPEVRAYVARALDTYDAVIVSTRQYARELRSWGVRAPIHASYPYLDESRRRVVTPSDIEAFEEKHGISGSDVVFTLVARMDPVKSHDVAVRALARIGAQARGVKLVLVGGGGFSGGRQGLGLTTAADWRATIEALARELGVLDRVVFTGGVTDEALDVAITRSRALILPSALEGFGLAAVEGWLYGKPVLVSRGAGVAELVEAGVNGFTFAPGDDEALAQAMTLLAHDEGEAKEMGAAGRRSARACHLDRGTADVWSVLRGVLDQGAQWRPTGRRS